MVNPPTPKAASFLSTGVVSRALGIDAITVRGMISSGSLPEPQWMTTGNSVERIYSLEWLLLANEKVNNRRLTGLEYEIAPNQAIQFAFRFEQASWTLSEVSKKIAGVDALWDLCASTLSPGEDILAPAMNVRRLSAGSPLDVLAWIPENWPSVVGAGGLASFFIYAMKSPDKVAGAIPRFVTAWRNGWADADDAAIRRIESRENRARFETEAAKHLRDIGSIPSETALSGSGTSRLELVSSDERHHPSLSSEITLDDQGDGAEIDESGPDPSSLSG
jgi:hypothetical protein